MNKRETAILNKIRNGIQVRNAAIQEAAGIIQEDEIEREGEHKPIPLKTVQQVLRDAHNLRADGKG